MIGPRTSAGGLASDSDDTRLPGNGGQPATETQLSEAASIAEQAGKDTKAALSRRAEAAEQLENAVLTA